MTALCKNGHITGYRHCPMCGADRTNDQVGLGKVLVSQNRIDLNTSLWWKTRRENKTPTGVQGPNKDKNYTWSEK